MSRRSFAGYVYDQKLNSGFYGEVYRANTAGGNEAALMEIDADLADMAGFSETLTAKGTELGLLQHPNVVDTRSVGRAPDGRLVVVTESQAGQLSAEELLSEAAPKGLPQHIAAGIGKQFLAGLAAAHELGIVHGAVHPRSVLVSRDGTAKLGDFAVGCALAAAIGKEVASPLRDSLTGYLAPEVVRGKPATRASDVYAAAAVVYVMLSGTLPPGTLDISPGFERMIQRALDPHMGRRYADAKEFLENLSEAMEDDLWPVASPAEVGAYIVDARTRLPEHRSASDVELEAATADLVSVLGAPAAPASPTGPSAQDAGVGVDMPTQVDTKPAGRMLERDPISELIALSSKGPVPEGVRALEPAPGSGAAGDGQGQAAAEPEAADAALAAIADLEAEEQPEEPAEAADAALAAIADLEAEEPAEPAEAAAPAARASSGEAARAVSQGASRAVSQDSGRAASAPDAGAEARPRAAAPLLNDIGGLDPGLDGALKKGGGLGRVLWFLVALGGVAALGWVIYTQSNLLKRAEKVREQQREANEAALAAFRESQPKSGRVIIDSRPDEAAVWMLLGRTPLDTNPMSASMLHELRLEFDGYVSQDVRVGAERWTGSGDDMKAEVRVDLRAGRPDEPLPAYPPAPPESARQGLPEGKGSIRVESRPSGAQVWLLVGFTPRVEVTGYAESDYEFKVWKDGYLPGYVSIQAEDWKADGNAEQVSRTVKLERRRRRSR